MPIEDPAARSASRARAPLRAAHGPIRHRRLGAIRRRVQKRNCHPPRWGSKAKASQRAAEHPSAADPTTDLGALLHGEFMRWAVRRESAGVLAADRARAGQASGASGLRAYAGTRRGRRARARPLRACPRHRRASSPCACSAVSNGQSRSQPEIAPFEACADKIGAAGRLHLDTASSTQLERA